MLDAIEYGYSRSVLKGIRRVQKGILYRLVASQHHHPLEPQMDGEHGAVFL